MKLNLSLLRYLTSEDFRVLHAVENGMRNHELVPSHLIASLSGLKGAIAYKVLNELVRHKLLGYDNRKGEGYRLTTAGYDFMALRTFAKRDTLASVGNKIGVGKESDIYIVANDEGEQLALKLHRLGRTSFRAIKRSRDYFQGRKHVSWLYLSHLAAVKEFAYMQVLKNHGFPVPTPVDINRNCIVMELMDATPMCNITQIARPDKVYHDLMELIVRLACHGLVHCDFNEFNLMISDDSEVTLIDFPQMVSTDHINAQHYFDRDVRCVRDFFERRFGYQSERYPRFEDIVREYNLDVEVAASGFTADHQKDITAFQDSKEEETEDEGSSDDEHENETPLEDCLRPKRVWKENEEEEIQPLSLADKEQNVENVTDKVVKEESGENVNDEVIDKTNLGDDQLEEIMNNMDIEERNEDDDSAEDEETLGEEPLSAANRATRAFRDPGGNVKAHKPTVDRINVHQRVRKTLEKKYRTKDGKPKAKVKAKEKSKRNIRSVVKQDAF
eukprot:m.175114 g.175114  ORF g.175114 m.175114 type:complete len:501 (-) comp15419_c0_seq1:5148-6650(-)